MSNPKKDSTGPRGSAGRRLSGSAQLTISTPALEPLHSARLVLSSIQEVAHRTRPGAPRHTGLGQLLRMARDRAHL